MQSLRVSEKLVNTAVRVASIFILTRVISALAAEMMRMHAYYLGVIPIEKSRPNVCAGQPRQQNVFGPFELNCRLDDDRHG